MLDETRARLHEIRNDTNSDRLALACAAYLAMAVLAYVIAVRSGPIEGSAMDGSRSQLLGATGLIVFGIPMSVSLLIAILYSKRRDSRNRWVWLTLNLLFGGVAVVAELAFRLASAA